MQPSLAAGLFVEMQWVGMHGAATQAATPGDGSTLRSWHAEAGSWSDTGKNADSRDRASTPNDNFRGAHPSWSC